MKENAYGLGWNRDIDPEKAELLCGKNFPVLKEIQDLALTKGMTMPDQQKLFGMDEVISPTHLLLEGDNLHSLACLCYTHRGQVHIIYIDPPYNTGNSDFMYNDKWIDSENKDRKSIWLSFMEKRLRQAKILLTEDGVIFISIDDNMLYELKLLCDKIFGPQNFVDTIIWDKGTGKNDSKYLVTTHEYILIYKKEGLEEFTKLPSDPESYKLEDVNGKYKLELFCRRGLSYSKSLDYIIKAPDGSNIYAGWDKENWQERQNGNKSSKDWCWMVSKTNYAEMLANDRIIFKNTKNGYKPYRKSYLSEAPGRTYVHGADGSNQLKDIFDGKVPLQYPKPVWLIRYLTSLHPNKNATVLDFFAGSGTTGHAVLELNKEDNGKRQFILCTNNENNIMTDVCYPRIKKVMTGYKKPNGESVESLGGTLKYFKTDFVEWHANLHELSHAVNTTCSGLLRVKEGVYNELENNEYYEIYHQDEDTLIAIYKGDYSVYPDAEELSELKGIMNGLDCSNKTLYIFALDWNADIYLREEFKDWKNTTLKIMPVEMIKEYKSLFNDGILKK